MSSPFDPIEVAGLIKSGLISTPLKIRSEIGSHNIEATLSSDGSVLMGNHRYTDIEQAMAATNRHPDSTSTPWQFWTYYSSERQAWTPLEHLRARLAARELPPEVRTSETHPLRIDAVTLPEGSGRIGMTFCPGKRDHGIYGGTWRRELSADLAALAQWGCKRLISLIERHEFELLGVPDFAQAVKGQPFDWLHLPIRDMQIPDANFEQRWRKAGPQVHRVLAAGDAIVIHCRGGLGRTGLLAARLLVESGLTPVDAIAKVRAARAHAIETYAQEHYILTQAWRTEH